VLYKIKTYFSLKSLFIMINVQSALSCSLAHVKCYSALMHRCIRSMWQISLLESHPHGNIILNRSKTCFLNLSFDVLSVICRLHNRRSPFKIPFYLVPPIVFSFRAKAFFYLGTIPCFSWNGTTVSHWMFHDNRRMKTSADVSKCKISLFSCKMLNSA
jgi:hypothetical protein